MNRSAKTKKELRLFIEEEIVLDPVLMLQNAIQSFETRRYFCTVGRIRFFSWKTCFPTSTRCFESENSFLAACFEGFLYRGNIYYYSINQKNGSHFSRPKH